MKNLWLGTALFWFLLAGVLGVILRAYNIFNLSFTYQNLLHAHSHLALLGWVFTALSGLIIRAFIPRSSYRKKHIIQLTLLTIANLGLVISFAADGYNLYSILFSTVHMATAIWFVTGALSELKSVKNKPLDLPGKLLKAGIFCMLLSSLGPLLMPVISATAGKTSFAYTNAVYFYLHFQINGWLTFSLLALFLKQFGISQTAGNKTNQIPVLLTLTTLLTVISSMKWPERTTLLSSLEITAAILLTYTTIILVRYFIQNRLQFLGTSQLKPEKTLLLFVFIAFITKSLIQIIAAIPVFAEIATNNRYLVIAFLHLYLIGVISVGIFTLIQKAGMFSFQQVWINTFLISFTCSEALIAIKGIIPINSVTSYSTEIALLLASTLMAGSIARIFIRYVRESLFPLSTQILNKIEYEN